MKRDDQGSKSPNSAGKPKTPTPRVRKSIGEWESGKIEASTRSPTKTLSEAGPSKPKQLSQDAQKHTLEGQNPPMQRNYADRTAEARACLSKAKLHLNNSRNLKTDIKTGVVQAIDRLYQLVKEAEMELKERKKKKKQNRRNMVIKNQKRV